MHADECVLMDASRSRQHEAGNAGVGYGSHLDAEAGVPLEDSPFLFANGDPLRLEGSVVSGSGHRPFANAVRVPSVFLEGTVLPRDTPVTCWGWGWGWG